MLRYDGRNDESVKVYYDLSSLTAMPICKTIANDNLQKAYKHDVKSHILIISDYFKLNFISQIRL